MSAPFPETHYEFGAFNERLVVERAVGDLLRSFREDGKMPEKATIAVGVERAWIENISTSRVELPWKDIPRLKWTEAAKDKRVRFFGGRHRMKACSMWRKVLEAERTTAINKLEVLRRGRDRETLKDEETVMEQLIARLDAAILDAQLWVCRLYILCEST